MPEPLIIYTILFYTAEKRLGRVCQSHHIAITLVAKKAGTREFEILIDFTFACVDIKRFPFVRI